MEEKKMTGYPSIDKPWLKYYKQEYIDAPLPHMTAYEYLKEQNAQRLDYIAIDSEMGQYTYQELFAQIDATAAALWNMGICKGKKVLSMFPVLPHESFLFYGVDAVGAALCQIAPQYTAADVCEHARRIDAEVFFVFDYLLTDDMERMIYQHTKIRYIVVVNVMPLRNRDERTIAWETFLEYGKDVLVPDISKDPSELLFLASTGGSTGEPKSVMLSDNCFNMEVHQYLNSNLEYCSQDRWMRLWPIFSATAAVSNMHLPLCAGMHMLLRQFSMEMTYFANVLLEDKPHHLMLIPQLMDVLENSPLIQDADLGFVKTVGCGGISITGQFEERVNRFFERRGIKTYLGYGWGCTENASSAAMRSSFETTAIGTVGAPLVKTIVSAFDSESGKEMQYGEEGELCISSPNLMMGYYRDSEMTRSVLRMHDDNMLWLHTGDLGSISFEGIVTVRGRMTRMILIGPNSKIYPATMEKEIAQVPGVQEVVFCAITNAANDVFFTPVCFIVSKNKEESESVREAVIQFCMRKYSEECRPKYVFLKEELPLTKVGKPDILALEKEAREYVKQ